MQVRGQLSGLGSFLPWSVLRIELRLPGLCGSCFYPLNHLTSHHAKLFTWLQRLELRKPCPYWVVSPASRCALLFTQLLYLSLASNGVFLCSGVALGFCSDAEMLMPSTPASPPCPQLCLMPGYVLTFRRFPFASQVAVKNGAVVPGHRMGIQPFKKKKKNSNSFCLFFPQESGATPGRCMSPRALFTVWLAPLSLSLAM